MAINIRFNIYCNMFEISVAIIVRNEERVIARLLDCVKKFADEIIIVDTGSTDKTVHIALGYTDKVFYCSWEGNFSYARNYAFSCATKEYVMWLDADDVISGDNIEKINKLKHSERADTYMLKYDIAFDENGNSTFSYYRERIMKNCSNAKWVGAVHEVIAPFGKIQYTDISIFHKKIAENEKGRNLKIYRNLIKNGHVLTEREEYYYARELYYNGYNNLAEKTLRKSIKKLSYKPDLREAYIMLADLLLKRKKYMLAINYLFSGLKVFQATSEYMCKIAEVFLYVDNLHISAVFYKAALQNNLDNSGFYKREYSEIIPALALCRIYYLLGDLAKSKEYQDLAKQFNPNDPRVLFNEKFFNGK